MGRKRKNQLPSNLINKTQKRFKDNNNTNTINENENIDSFPRIINRHSFNRISMISNSQRKMSCIKAISNTLYLDLGDCIHTCQYCGAFFWFNERSNENTPPRFNLCCQNGKISLPLLRETPPMLDNLLNYNGGYESTYYRKNI